MNIEFRIYLKEFVFFMKHFEIFEVLYSYSYLFDIYVCFT